MSALYEEEIEIPMENLKHPDASARNRTGQIRGLTPAVSGGKILKMVVVSFGLVCTLQATLNVCLRSCCSDDKWAGLDKVSSLEASLKNLIQERDKLKRQLKDFDEYSTQLWKYFSHSFYSVSSIKKNWHDSRADCLHRGADLMIINSKEELAFARRFKKQFWIGLNDTETEGIWKWLDGTSMDSSYWAVGEPNHFQGRNEDCGEMKKYNLEKCLNDLQCQDENFWICEKTIVQ